MTRNFIYATCPQCTGTVLLIIDLNARIRIASIFRANLSKKPTLATYCPQCDATYPLPDQIEIERTVEQTQQEPPEITEPL